MTVTVSPYVVWGVLSLALFGVVFVWRVARDAARDVRAWWHDRREDRGDEDEAWPEHVEAALLEERPPLPPEQSDEALGFRRRRVVPAEVLQLRRAEAKRRRLALAAELEHRAAYEAMGLEFPSGLMARVREAAP